MQNTNFYSDSFKPEAFLPPIMDPKIFSRANDFTTQEKINLGKKVSRLMKGSRTDYSAFGSKVLNQKNMSTYHLEVGDAYIKLAQKRRVEIVKQGVSEALQGLDGENAFTESLSLALEKLDNLDSTASQKEIKTAIDDGLSALLKLAKSENEVGTVAEIKTSHIFKAFIDQGIITDSDLEDPRAVRRHSSLESTKGFTEEAQKEALAVLFDIRNIPEISPEGLEIAGKFYSQAELVKILAANNAQKRNLVTACLLNPENLLQNKIPLATASQIASQTKMYPLIQAAVIKIRENLEEWDTLILADDSEALESIEGLIGQQLENLSVLVALIAKEVKTPEDMQALSLFTDPSEELKDNFSFDLYLTGDDKLSIASNREKAIGAIKANLEIVKKSLERSSNEGPSTKLPLSKNSIHARAELQKATREGKAWGILQKGLTAEGKSVNLVFKLRHPTFRNRTVAYFKQNIGNTKEQKQAAGLMERIMYDISESLGVSDQFVPTGQTTLHTKPDLENGTSTSMVWKGTTLVKMKETYPGHPGGIQVAIAGNTLAEEKNQNTANEISQKEVAQGVATSIVFGMFDAHSSNIMISTEGIVESKGEICEVVFQNDGQVVKKDGEIVPTPIKIISQEKKILFFDNTRSLPTANGFINRGVSDVRISYRCALLELEQSNTPLSKEILTSLKQSVDSCKKNVENLEAYINNPLSGMRARLEKLPPGWMDIDKSIAAMKGRIDLMEQALAAGSVSTLRDLVEQANPNYRFAYVLAVLKDASYNTTLADSRSLVRDYHSLIGRIIITEQVENAAQKGFDIKRIKSWCDDLTIPLEEVMDKLREHHEEIKNNITFSERNNRKSEAKVISEAILKSAAIDYKDWNHSVELLNLTALQNQPVLISSFNKEYSVEGNLLALIKKVLSKKTSEIQLLHMKDGRCIAVYNTPLGPGITELNLGTLPNKVKIANEELTIDDFISKYRSKTTISYSEVHYLHQGDVERLYRTIPSDTIIFRKSGDLKTLVAHSMNTGGTQGRLFELRFSLVPGSENEFIGVFDGQHYSFEDIVSKIKKIKVLYSNVAALKAKGVVCEEINEKKITLAGAVANFMRSDLSGIYLIKTGMEKYFIAYNTLTGPLIKEVNLGIAEDLVELDGIQLALNDFHDQLFDDKLPTYEELPAFSEYQAEQILANAPLGAVVIRKAPTKNVKSIAIVLNLVPEGPPKSHKFFPVTEEKELRDKERFYFPEKGGQPLTMTEITNELLCRRFVSLCYPDSKVPSFYEDLPDLVDVQIEAILARAPVGAVLISKTQRQELGEIAIAFNIGPEELPDIYKFVLAVEGKLGQQDRFYYQVRGETPLTMDEIVNRLLCKEFVNIDSNLSYDKLPAFSQYQAEQILANAQVGAMLIRKAQIGEPEGITVSLTVENSLESTSVKKYPFLRVIEKDGLNVEEKFYQREDKENTFTIDEIVTEVLKTAFVHTYTHSKAPNFEDIPYLSGTQVDTMLNGEPVGSMVLSRIEELDKEGNESFVLEIMTPPNEVRAFQFFQYNQSNFFQQINNKNGEELFTIQQIVDHYRNQYNKQ